MASAEEDIVSPLSDLSLETQNQLVGDVNNPEDKVDRSDDGAADSGDNDG